MGRCSLGAAVCWLAPFEIALPTHSLGRSTVPRTRASSSARGRKQVQGQGCCGRKEEGCAVRLGLLEGIALLYNMIPSRLLRWRKMCRGSGRSEAPCSCIEVWATKPGCAQARGLKTAWIWGPTLQYEASQSPSLLLPGHHPFEGPVFTVIDPPSLWARSFGFRACAAETRHSAATSSAQRTEFLMAGASLRADGPAISATWVRSLDLRAGTAGVRSQIFS